MDVSPKTLWLADGTVKLEVDSIAGSLSPDIDVAIELRHVGPGRELGAAVLAELAAAAVVKELRPDGMAGKRNDGAGHAASPGGG